MTIASNLTIPTKIDLFKSAEIFVRKRFWKLWLSFTIFIPSKERGYSFLCYRYLRWSDDIVDISEIGIKDKRSFIKSQIVLLKQIVNRESFEITHTEEFDLYYLIVFALETNRTTIIEEVKRTLEGIKYDVDRMENLIICTENELNKVIAFQAETFCNMANHFILPSYNRKDKPIYNGAFFWFVLILKDFNEDVNSRLINISREDIEKFGLDVKTLATDEKRFSWLRYKYPSILNLLEKEKVVLKTYPLRIKLFWLPGYFYTLYKLNKINEYGFRFGIKVKSEILKEIKIFVKTVKMYVNFNIGVLGR